jgi:hypothetical protein
MMLVRHLFLQDLSYKIYFVFQTGANIFASVFVYLVKYNLN